MVNHLFVAERVDAGISHPSAARRGSTWRFRKRPYADIRRFEGDLNLGRYPPVEAIRRLIEFTFDYDEAHPDLIRLVATENTLNARNIATSASIQAVDRSAIATLRGALIRGKRDGIFRQDVDPVDVHLLISSFCFYRVSNRFTFRTLFGRDLSDPGLYVLHKRMLIEAVLNAVTARKTKASRAAASEAA